MRVLHFFKTYYPDSFGGIEQVIFQLAEGCRQHHIDTEVLYLSPRGNARNEPCAQHQTHRSQLDIHLASTGFSLHAFRDFRDLAAHADLIHYHFPWPFMDLVHFSSQLKKPTLLTYHSDIVKQKNLARLYRPLMNRFLRSVNHIVATSPNYLATSPVLAQYADKTSVIPIGINPSSYPAPDPQRLDYWQRQFPGPFFLFIGALRYYKGLHTLLEALSGSQYPVALIGSGPLGPALQEHIRRRQLTHVHLLGSLPDQDKTALLQLCHGLVLPSHLRSEAFGIALLEGAMFGKPLISCEIGSGTSHINQHGVTGLVTAPDDPAALRHALDTLWHEPALATRLGQAARQRFDRHFTADIMSSQYAALYQTLCASTR